MSDRDKQNGSWYLLQRGISILVILVILVGTGGGIYFLFINRNEEWTGFGETIVTTKRKIEPINKDDDRYQETDDERNIIAIPESDEILSRKTLWDWLELSSRLAVPILLAVFGVLFQWRERKKADKQAEQASQLAQNNLAEEAIEAYLKSMGDILLNEEQRKELFPKSEEVLKAATTELKKALETEVKLATKKLGLATKKLEAAVKQEADTEVKEVLETAIKVATEKLEAATEKLEVVKAKVKVDNHVRDIVRALTIAILRRLGGDQERQAVIFRFLYDVEDDQSKENLRNFIFKGATLSELNLSNCNWLWQVNLEGATLWKTNLTKANLKQVNLEGAMLRKAILSEANLKRANLEGANLKGANLEGANLKGANLKGANLKGANLKGAYLLGVDLSKAEDLSEAQLKGAYYTDKTIKEAVCQKLELYSGCITFFPENFEPSNKKMKSIKTLKEYEAMLKNYLKRLV